MPRTGAVRTLTAVACRLDGSNETERTMGTLPLVAIGLVVLFVAWRLFLRTQGTWVEVPADPHAYVNPELVPLVDWMAQEAEEQIGRGLVIAGDPFALGAIAEAAESLPSHAPHRTRCLHFKSNAYPGDHGGRKHVGKCAIQDLNL